MPGQRCMDPALGSYISRVVSLGTETSLGTSGSVDTGQRHAVRSPRAQQTCHLAEVNKWCALHFGVLICLTHFHIACPALQPFPYSRAALRYILTVRDGGDLSDAAVSCLSVPLTPFPLFLIVARCGSLLTLVAVPVDPGGAFVSVSRGPGCRAGADADVCIPAPVVRGRRRRGEGTETTTC